MTVGRCYLSDVLTTHDFTFPSTSTILPPPFCSVSKGVFLKRLTLLPLPRFTLTNIHTSTTTRMPLSTSASHPSGPNPTFSAFPSRRSVVHSNKGIVSSTQPLATQCGLEILRKGGNCADAAVAVAAGLNMTEPGSTGIGGDMFCLFYEAKTKKVHSLNGSGRSGKECTAEKVRGSLGLKEGEFGRIGLDSVQAVTVPGAPAGWVDCVERFGSGKVGMGEILGPAIELGEEGFVVGEIMGASVSLRTLLAGPWDGMLKSSSGVEARVCSNERRLMERRC